MNAYLNDIRRKLSELPAQLKDGVITKRSRVTFQGGEFLFIRSGFTPLAVSSYEEALDLIAETAADWEDEKLSKPY